MPDLNYGLLFGVLVTTLPPIIYSIWKETRFVRRGTASLYAFASIGFGIMYGFDVGFTDIGWWAVGIFSALGVIFLIVYWRDPDIWDDERSLPFSHKTIGGFQLSFLYYRYVSSSIGSLPLLSNTISVSENVVLWGGICTLILFMATAVARWYKN